MLLIRTADRERLTTDQCPPDLPVSSAGQFMMRADGTGRFDRHYHDFGEFWFIAEGRATILVGDERLQVIAGDIVYTPSGVEHDIETIASPLRVFWLSGPPTVGGSGAHLHTSPEHAAKHLVPVEHGGPDA